MLAQVTPLILTHNEAPNIARTLAPLSWAQDIVVVDSGSTDATRQILAEHSNVRVFERAFTTHAEQWNFGLQQTGIQTPWVLALDADYVLSDALLRELEALAPSEIVDGFKAAFVYCIHGKPLRGSLYPPVTVLFRRARARYLQFGHTQQVSVDGRVESLHAPIFHDDRKSVGRWLESQARYVRLEADRLLSTPMRALRWQDWIRNLWVVAPLLVPVYVLLVRGAILDGWHGMFYASQRALVEGMLSVYLMKGRIAGKKEDR